MMRIAISGINANDNPGPGVGVARSLKLADPSTEIVGLSYDANDSGHYLRGLFDRTVMMPLPGRGGAELKKKLAALHAESPIDLVIPCLDAELPLYMQHQAEIEREIGIRLFLPSLAQFEARGKDKLAALAKKLGAKHPKTVAVTSLEGLRKAVDEGFPFPFYVKGKYYKAYRVSSHYEAQLRFDEISAEWGFPILLQQIVPGMESNLIGLADGKGNLLGSVSIKKTATTYLGKIWTAVTIRNDKLVAIAEAFARATKWRGGFELECIATPKDTHIIEINPRFPAWAYFATACGVNLPQALVDTALGREVPPLPHAPVGKLLVRYCDELVVDWAQMIQPARPEKAASAMEGEDATPSHRQPKAA